MVSFSPDVFDAFLAEHDDTAVVMLNLIKFQPDGGRARYFEYLEMAKPMLARFGAKVLFGGDGARTRVGCCRARSIPAPIRVQGYGR